MKMHLHYAWYVIRHKWYVFLACCKLGVPWLGLIHDLSKLLPSEWGPYARHFYGAKRVKVAGGDPDFDMAWLYHARRNKHHWLWWSLGEQLFPMPDRYRREMLADWRGASMAIIGKDNTADWYVKNRDKMRLHPETQRWIEENL